MDRPWLHDLGVSTQLLGWWNRNLEGNRPILFWAAHFSVPVAWTTIRMDEKGDSVLLRTRDRAGDQFAARLTLKVVCSSILSSPR
jgi:hypothetical protein